MGMAHETHLDDHPSRRCTAPVMCFLIASLVDTSSSSRGRIIASTMNSDLNSVGNSIAARILPEDRLEHGRREWSQSAHKVAPPNECPTETSVRPSNPWTLRASASLSLSRERCTGRSPEVTELGR